MLYIKKIKYDFVSESGYPAIRSNLVDNELDLLELVGSDAGSKRTICKCIETIEKKKVWWSNASKIEHDGSDVIISPAFEWDASCKVPREELLLVLFEYRKAVLMKDNIKKSPT